METYILNSMQGIPATVQSNIYYAMINPSKLNMMNATDKFRLSREGLA